jgi:hypothetical protein
MQMSTQRHGAFMAIQRKRVCESLPQHLEQTFKKTIRSPGPPPSLILPSFSKITQWSQSLSTDVHKGTSVWRSRLLKRSNTSGHAAAIREFDAKLLLAYWLERAPPIDPAAHIQTQFVYPSVKVAQIGWDPTTDSITPDSLLPGWISTTRLVAKPDQLIKQRGKAGLKALNQDWGQAREWIAARAGKLQKVLLFSRSPIVGRDQD